MPLTHDRRVNIRTQTKPPEDGYYSVSREDFMALVRAFEQVFGLLCFRETKHFRHASPIEPAKFSSFDMYKALVHMIDTANTDENDNGINTLRNLMVSYLGPLDQIIAVKLLGRHCYVIAPKVWMNKGCAH